MNHDSRDTAPRLVLGDFNEWPRGLTSHLLETHFNTAEPRRRLGRARSYPGILPLAHVDHIYYDSPLEAATVSIRPTHRPVMKPTCPSTESILRWSRESQPSGESKRGGL